MIKDGDLTASLTDEQNKLFEANMSTKRAVNIFTDLKTFIYSFRVGAKIMIDVLTDGNMREI